MAWASTAEPECILPQFLNSQPDLQLTAIMINAVAYTTSQLATLSKSTFETSQGGCKCAKVANVRRCKGEDAACKLTRCYVSSTVRMLVGQAPSTLVPASNQAPEALLPMQGRQAGPRLSTSSGDATASLPTGAGASASQATLSSEGSRRGARGGGGAVALPSARCGVLYEKNSTTASCVCGNTHACQASGRRRHFNPSRRRTPTL